MDNAGGVGANIYLVGDDVGGCGIESCDGADGNRCAVHGVVHMHNAVHSTDQILVAAHDVDNADTNDVDDIGPGSAAGAGICDGIDQNHRVPDHIADDIDYKSYYYPEDYSDEDLEQ